MADHVATKHPLRHPAEIPTFVIMVLLNIVILLILIDFLASLALIPPALRGTNWQAVWRVAAAAIILVAPAARRCSCPGPSSLTCTPRWMTSPRAWA
jgi:hypothetical protein